MNQDQARRRIAEELLSDEELDAISNGINGIQPQMCLRDTRRMMAKKAIAAALVKFTQGQEPVAQFVKAPLGNYPELAWRDDYKARIGDKFYTHPIPSQQEDRKPLTDDLAVSIVRAAMDEEADKNENGTWREFQINIVRKVEAAHNIKEQK